MAFRGILCNLLKGLWPCDITVGGKRVEALRLGLNPDREIQGETVQFASCAAGRLAHYMLTGTIPAHLVRNSVIAANAAAAVPKAVPKKRPATSM